MSGKSNESVERKGAAMSKNSGTGITEYRGWVIRPKKGKFQVAFKNFSNFPVMVDSIEQAKKDIDWIEDGKEYAEGKKL
jgi:hypothetical protein